MIKNREIKIVIAKLKLRYLRFRRSDLNPKMRNLFIVYTENLDSIFTLKWVHLMQWTPQKCSKSERKSKSLISPLLSLTYTYCWLFLFPPPPSISSSFLINTWVPFVFLYTHSDTQKVSIFLTWLFHIFCDVMWCVTTIDIFVQKSV